MAKIDHDQTSDAAKIAMYLAHKEWGPGWLRLNTEVRRGILLFHVLQIATGKVQINDKKFHDGSKWTADDIASALRTCENWGKKDFSDLSMMAKPKTVSRDMTASLFEMEDD